jgi:hypothetical protein
LITGRNKGKSDRKKDDSDVVTNVNYGVPSFFELV